MTTRQGVVTCWFWTMVQRAREATSKLALLGQPLKLNTLLVLWQRKKLFGCIAFYLVFDIHNWIPHLCYLTIKATFTWFIILSFLDASKNWHSISQCSGKTTYRRNQHVLCFFRAPNCRHLHQRPASNQVSTTR